MFFCDLIRQEVKSRSRIVTETDRFIVLEPYAARFPFETWILPKQHKSHFEDVDPANLENLASVLRSTLRKIEKVLEWPPYNFLIHTAPRFQCASTGTTPKKFRHLRADRLLRVLTANRFPDRSQRHHAVNAIWPARLSGIDARRLTFVWLTFPITLSNR